MVLKAVIFGKAGNFDASINLSALNGTNGFKLTVSNGTTTRLVPQAMSVMASTT